MKRIINLATYGNDRYIISKKRIKREAEDFGVFNNIHICGPEDLSEEFKEKFKDILSVKKGGGFWIWKPYIINKLLEQMNDGEYLVYIDSGCTINSNGLERFNQYLDMLDNSEYGFLGFQMRFQEKYWTKQEIFHYFKIDRESEIGNSGQYHATIFMLKKNEHSQKVVKMWLDILNKRPVLFTDTTRRKGRIKRFVDTRHDQSILSFCCKILGCCTIKDETFYKDWYNGRHIPFLATRIRL